VTQAIKAKTCRLCRVEFMPRRPLQAVCSLECAIQYAARPAKQRRSAAEALQRKKDREAREALKPKAKWLSEAQSAFNQYIRFRDAHLPCISCGQSPYQGQRHASHYRSVGAASHLRFNTWNVHASCAQCNSMKSGNVVEYRIALVRKIGQHRIDQLENDNQPKTFEIEYIKRLKKIFTRRAKHYKKIRGLA
jgi:predicted metal-dependent hydrolase